MAELASHRGYGPDERRLTLEEWFESLSRGETTLLGGTLSDITEWKKAFLEREAAHG